jgi:hypothetical protein
MTHAIINQTAINFYTTLVPSEFEAAVYAMAGRIAMDGCRHGRLCQAHAMHAAALANCGPDDSDNDTHREWRRNARPAAARLVSIAEQAYLLTIIAQP